ncbi:MAG: hypothetical protein CMN76_15240 [Spirochaetaceae bacterium]|nr:hypothetical protein [Spirochaetaceae bacterium]|tara:strand:- start:6917 stop:9205 length:2289 start_codon:yes stop_codon:yes gene_type:complete
MMKRSANLAAHLTIFLFFFCHHPSQARPLYSDPFEMLRAGRWAQILRHFESRTPRNKSDFYALARAMQQSKGHSGLQAVAPYLNVVRQDCMRGSSESDLNQCLDRIPEHSVRDLLERLALYRAQEASQKELSQSAREKILSRVDLRKGDVLDQKILQKRLDILIDMKQVSKAAAIADKFEHVSGDYTEFLKGRAYRQSGNTNKARDYLFKAAEMDPPGWLMKAIYYELKKNDPALPNAYQDQQHYRRKLVLFQQYIPSSFYRDSATFSPENLIATSNAITVEADGMVLLELGKEKEVLELSSRAYTFLSSKPGKLRTWAYHLRKANRVHVAKQLFKRFEHAKSQDASLWHIYLDILKKSGNKDEYFKELVAYLNVNHADYETHDELIEFLIGDDPDHLHWAEKRYWDYARSMMPSQAGSGRFVYWLYRYNEKNDPAANEELLKNFYTRMPGSYYKQAFWDLNESAKKTSYRDHWSYVRDQSTYLGWVSRYGGNEQALAFLAKKNLSAYWNEDAVRILRDLKRDQDSIPEDIVELFQLGEWQLGMEFFRDKYKGKVSDYQFMRRLAQVGLRGNTLFISVYYTRNLLRDSKVSEDPFTLPPELLRILYPRPYHTLVQKYGETFKVDESMVYGLMRQESMFRELAISRSGARGLMQIMPKTGEWLASRSNMRNYDLLDPETSIRLGSMFFADLLRMYDQDFRWASIAYNGGPGNLKKWKARYYNGDFNHFLEHIPKAESRNYCRITHQNYMHYWITDRIYGQGLN